MKYFNWKNEWFGVVTILAGVGVTLAWYNRLPSAIPSHWNVYGQIDGWTTPTGHVAMFLGLMSIMYLLFLLIPHLEPRKENLADSLKFLHATKNALLAFFLVLYVAISYQAVFMIPFAIEKLISIGIGILFIIIGRYLTQTKSNYFMGIRTPWTLHSESIWEKTHKLGSTTFVIAGLIFIASSVLPIPLNSILPMVGIFLAGIIPVVYSYILFRNQK